MNVNLQFNEDELLLKSIYGILIMIHSKKDHLVWFVHPCESGSCAVGGSSSCLVSQGKLTPSEGPA